MNKIAMDLIEKLQPDNHWIDSKYFKLKMSNAKAQGSWGEQYVAETLRQEGHTAEIVTVPEYDLLVNDSIKVEVKFGMARIEKGETLLDLIMWQHLFFDKADVFAFVGVNPDFSNYRVRAGWRDEVEELFILYFTNEQLKKFALEGGLILEQGRQGSVTSKAFLRRLDYCKDFRSFPVESSSQ